MGSFFLFEDQVTFLYTRNLSATSRFYQEVLELELVLDQGSCRIYRVSPTGYLGFCEKEQTAENHPDIILTLVTSNVDEVYHRLRGKGVQFEKEPVHNPAYQIYHCFFRDPNGYLLEVQSFEDPRWTGSSDK